MSKILDNARNIRALLLKVVEHLNDADASIAPDMFPKLKYDGSLISVGTRINWNGAIKKAAADLWDTEENNPDNAPALWADINYREGIRIIPETITAAEQFAKGELGWWGNEVYRSMIEGNVYTPEQYAAGWEVVEL